MATNDFKHESLQDLKSIGKYLVAITEGLQAGRVNLSDENGQLALHPAGLVHLELRAQCRANQGKLQLELTWTEDNGTRADSLSVRSDGTR